MISSPIQNSGRHVTSSTANVIQPPVEIRWITDIPGGLPDVDIRAVADLTVEYAVGGKSLFGVGSYRGPCTPPNTTPHHYTFVLIATDFSRYSRRSPDRRR